MQWCGWQKNYYDIDDDNDGVDFVDADDDVFDDDGGNDDDGDDDRNREDAQQKAIRLTPQQD